MRKGVWQRWVVAMKRLGGPRSLACIAESPSRRDAARAKLAGGQLTKD